MTTIDSPFLNLTAELRLMVYKRTAKYAVARRDEYGAPVVVFVLSYIDRAIVAVPKLVRKEAESVINSETQKCGPVQLILDCEYFHLVPEILANLRDARNGLVQQNMGLAGEEREDFDTRFTNKELVEEARMDAVMTQMWTRLANLYLKPNERIEVGIWTGNDPACEIFVEKLDSAIEDIVSSRWDASDSGMYRPKFRVTIQCSEGVESSDVQGVVQTFKDARFDVIEESEPEEMGFGWGFHIFGGLFEAKELSSNGSSEEANGDVD